MPVQINEIVVRATVSPSAAGAQGSSCSPDTSTGSGLPESANDEIAEKVLEILKSKKER